MAQGFPNEAPPIKDSYAAQWIGILFVAGLAVWVWLRPHPALIRLSAPPVASGQGVEWFLVIRLPEVSPEEADTAAAEVQLTSWLEGLRRAGFQPMLLSSVLSQLSQGLKLPRKTVVFVVYPGHRHTHDILAPILARQHCPAAWLTDRAAIQRADHRYLSQHALGEMAQSGLWDVGWSEGSLEGDVVTFDLVNEELVNGKSSGAKPRVALDLRVNHKALNQGREEAALSHLNIPLPWTAEELVQRLAAETPVKGPAYLTAQHIGSRVWGVAIERAASDQQQLFDLHAPMETRMASLAWPGTIGKNDLLLELNFLSRAGDVWVLLRSNPAIKQAVQIGFTAQALLVEQDDGGTRTRLAMAPWPASSENRVTATILLRGHHLELAVNHQPALSVETIHPPADPHGLVELFVYDKVRGAADVKLASVIFAPLDRPRHDIRKTATPSRS